MPQIQVWRARGDGRGKWGQSLNHLRFWKSLKSGDGPRRCRSCAKRHADCLVSFHLEKAWNGLLWQNCSLCRSICWDASQLCAMSFPKKQLHHIPSKHPEGLLWRERLCKMKLMRTLIQHSHAHKAPVYLNTTYQTNTKIYHMKWNYDLAWQRHKTNQQTKYPVKLRWGWLCAFTANHLSNLKDAWNPSINASSCSTSTINSVEMRSEVLILRCSLRNQAVPKQQWLGGVLMFCCLHV